MGKFVNLCGNKLGDPAKGEDDFHNVDIFKHVYVNGEGQVCLVTNEMTFISKYSMRETIDILNGKEKR